MAARSIPEAALFTRRHFLGLALPLALAACSNYVPQSATTPEQATTARIAGIVNDVRAANGRKPLIYDVRLAAAAKRQAELMAQKDTLSHDLGETLRQRVRAAGYIGAVGEDVAGGQKTLEAAIAGWLNSGPHRNTLLSPHFTEFGLGVARVAAGTDSRYGVYWSIILGGDSAAFLQ